MEVNAEPTKLNISAQPTCTTTQLKTSLRSRVERIVKELNVGNVDGVRVKTVEKSYESYPMNEFIIVCFHRK